MTDDERAELEAGRFTERALANHRQNHEALSGQSLEFCDECGNDIPEARRLALPGVALCVECKRAEELQGRRG